MFTQKHPHYFGESSGVIALAISFLLANTDNPLFGLLLPSITLVMSETSLAIRNSGRISLYFALAIAQSNTGIIFLQCAILQLAT